MPTWLTKIFNYDVERKEIHRRNKRPYIPMAATGIGVLHTTEGLNINGAWTTLNAHFSAPHFIVGDYRIIQCRPLGMQAAALLDTPQHPNKYAYVQVEMCAFTGGNADFKKHGMKPWIPIEGTLKPLVALMAYCSGHGINIPLQRPCPDWLDDCSDIKTIWAIAGNTRRKSGVWPKGKGWYYHLEVAGNNHYDCGAMRCTDIFAMARELLGEPQTDQPSTPIQVAKPEPKPEPKPKPSPKPSSPAQPQKSNNLIRRGDRGKEVKQLQAQLIKLGYLGKGADDGIFGPRTHAAVRKFQSHCKLRVDGIVGPRTSKALSSSSPQKK
ncbi:MAG TPA: peptidoglycan-binding domain-containing protein [Pyrinomonadaceae bacterium]